MKQARLFAPPLETHKDYLENVLIVQSIAQGWAKIADHYLTPGATIADLTHRTGRQWGLCLEKYNVLAFDLDPKQPVQAAADAGAIPLQRESVDAIVFDPPWLLGTPHESGVNAEKYSAPCKKEEDVLNFIDSARWLSVLKKPHGLVFVRCQSYHHGGKFRPFPYLLWNRLENCGPFSLWDEVTLLHGAIRPRHAMDQKAPKTMKVSSLWQVYKISKERL